MSQQTALNETKIQMAERGALEKHAPEICQGQKDDHTSGLHGEMTEHDDAGAKSKEVMGKLIPLNFCIGVSFL